MRIVSSGSFATAGPIVTDGISQFMFVPAHLISTFNDSVILDQHNKTIGVIVCSWQELDVSLVKLTKPFQVESMRLRPVGAGMHVEKMGEATGYTVGYILSIDEGYLRIRSCHVFASFGDSGSIVRFLRSDITCGMLLRGGSGLEYTAISIQTLMSLLPSGFECVRVMN